MLENFTATTELKFKELSAEDKQARGILGRLYGPIASILDATRNGRKYKESLWEKAFKHPLVVELLSQGGIPGELDHPTDREETCSEKIAIMMPEAPTKDSNGELMGYFDILDTPCGRIAYSLAKYGFNLGISSRGSGDTFINDEGEEEVDEDTYLLNAFDLVLLPACKNARLKLAESFNNNRIKFNESIQKTLNDSNEHDKKIITETLNNLKLLENTEPETQGTDDKKTNETNENEVAVNDGTNLVESLQESLIENQSLQKQVLLLQERLSVSYTKELKLEATIESLNNKISSLNESVTKNAALSNQLRSMKQQLEDQCGLVSKERKLVEKLQNRIDSQDNSINELTESINEKTLQVSKLKRQALQLNEGLKESNSKHQLEVQELNSQISDLKTEAEIKQSQYSKKLNETNKLVESYKTIAKKAVDKYIDSKATTLGVSTDDIKRRLNENYSFNDIDKICDNLRDYKRNFSKLPFNMTQNKISKVTLNEGLNKSNTDNPDDIIDKDLFNLINN